jgi:hypothetical protein
MAAANEGANLLHDAVTPIPIYTGDGNDVFTPNQWIKRIQDARDTARWNDENTMSFVFMSLLEAKHSNGMNVYKGWCSTQ